MRVTARESLLDAVTLVILVAAFWVLHVPVAFHGMSWGDPSWYFHFGRRVLHGSVPYKDFVFQVGPLPIFVDAAAQKIFGEGYRASLIAGLSVKLVRLCLTYLIARRLASRALAVTVVTFLAFERIWYSFAHHWSVGYTQISLLTCTLLVVMAHQRPERRPLYVALAGGSLGLMVGARQSNAMVATALMFAVTSVVAVRGTTWLSRPLLIRFWGGYAIAIVLLAGTLAAMGALGPAVQQMFLDAPQKKNVGGFEAVADAITGGWASQPKLEPGLTLWRAFIKYQSAPLLVSFGILLCLARPRLAAPLVLFTLPLAFVLGNFTTFAILTTHNDLPRTFATLALLWLVVTPRHAERAFGIPREILVVLTTLPLAMEWGMELSFPGRGWAEVASFLTMGLLLFVGTKLLPRLPKLAFVGFFALVGCVQFAEWRADDQNPFVKYDYFEGRLADNRFSVDNPMLRGLKVNQPRAHFLAWLTSHVRPGDGCFVYGSMPAVYDLLDCRNPSALDTTAADFVTTADVERAVAALERTPPKWIIAQETHWMNPDLEIPFTGDDGLYAGLNPRASKALHQGLRSLLPHYEIVGSSREHLTASDLDWADKVPDQLGKVRLYRLHD